MFLKLQSLQLTGKIQSNFEKSNSLLNFFFNFFSIRSFFLKKIRICAEPLSGGLSGNIRSRKNLCIKYETPLEKSVFCDYMYRKNRKGELYP